MNYEQEIKKLEKQIEELKQKIEAEKEAPPVWVLGENDHYYLLTIQGDVVEYFWSGTEPDCARLDTGNVFRTEQEAKNCLRALKLIETIRRERFKAQGNWWPSEDETMFSICWDRLKNDLGVITTSWLLPSSVFGLWQDLGVMRDVIDKYDSELGWYFVDYLPSTN